MSEKWGQFFNISLWRFFYHRCGQHINRRDFSLITGKSGIFSYLYISITGIFFLRALKNGLIPPSEWYWASSDFTIPFFLQEECPYGHSKVSVQLLNGFRVTHVPTKQPCNADILQSRISRVITWGTPFPVDADHNKKSINIMTEISKNGRPPSPNRCTHCVMVRFDDLDDDGRIHKRRKKKS